MLRSIFTKSLRDYRWAILGWGLGLGLVVYAQYATFASTFTGASAAQIASLVQQFQFFGEAVRVGTPGGFVTFKIMGLLPVILGVWTVLAGARMVRGEEERNALDIILSTPRSCSALLTQRLSALAVATGLICLLIGALTALGMASAHVNVDPWSALLAGFNAGLTALLFGIVALVLSQFMRRVRAAEWAGGLMVGCFVLDGTGRTTHGAGALRAISPLYYYDQNLPLVPGYTPSPPALLVLVILCLAGSALAVPLFLRRDVGRTVLADLVLRQAHPRPKAEGVRRADSLWTRGVGLLAFRQGAGSMIWWGISLALFAGYLVVVARTSEKQIQDLIGGSSLFRQIFNGENLGTNAGFVSALVFGYLPLLLCVFGGIMASRWASDLENGRMELVLATPQLRWGVLLTRYGAVLAAVVIVVLAVWLAIVVCAKGAGFALDGGSVAAACIGMLPLVLITASLVFALAGIVRPAGIAGIMAVFLGLSYLTDMMKTLLHLPGWVADLSIFKQYGTPLLHGLNWGSFIVMLLLALAMLALGTWQFSVRDVDRGAA